MAIQLMMKMSLFSFCIAKYKTDREVWTNQGYIFQWLIKVTAQKKSEFSSPTDSLYVVYCRWNYFPAGSQIIHQFNLGMIKLFPVSADVTRWWCWGADGERKEMGCSEAPFWALLLQVGFLFPELGRCLITVCHMESCLLIFVGLSGSFTRDHNTVPLMMPAVFSSVHNSLLLLQPQSSERWSFYKLISPQPSRTGFFFTSCARTEMIHAAPLTQLELQPVRSSDLLWFELTGQMPSPSLDCFGSVCSQHLSSFSNMGIWVYRPHDPRKVPGAGVGGLPFSLFQC